MMERVEQERGIPTEQTVNFYYDYGAGDIPSSTGLLITVEKTA